MACSCHLPRNRCACVCLVVSIIMFLTVVGLFLFVFGAIVTQTGSYPWHASCQIDWDIGHPCEEVQQKLANQFEEWHTRVCPGISDSCPKLPCGQKCKYNLTSSTADEITGFHETPNPANEYIDELTFTFVRDEESDPGRCKVKGYSTSQLWYAILDWGTNYCNLRNLIEGAGFDKTANFEEKTSTSTCTHYDIRDCTRF